jgi:hypothetical protein
VISSGASTISPDEKRRALDRVLNSQTFSRSDQLKRFLRYVCEKEIAGRADEISEYSIGMEALGKRSDYSPGEDSSVRTRAHVLRQKLQEFYELEDPASDLRIEMPRGSYSPHFGYYVPQLLDPAPVSEARLRAALRSPWLWPFAAGILAASLVFAIVSWFGTFWRPADKIDSMVREAWGDLLKAGERVDVCLGTPPAMLLHSFREHRIPANPTYIPAPDVVLPWYQGLQMLDGGGKLYMHTTQDIALVGDCFAAISAMRLLTAAGVAARAVSERDLRPYALRDRNVILIGSPNYSPYAARVLGATALTVRYDPASREEVIADQPTNPLPHTMFKPDRDEFGNRTTAYGLITVFPSQGGEGNARTVIFSGITAAGPQAAMEFFKSSPDLRSLKARLISQGYKRLPSAYQVVVRCALDHNLALNWAYVTHRVLDRSPL